MDWDGLEAWRFSRVGTTFVVKVADTALDTKIGDEKKDKNVHFSTHVTSSGRLIGYTLKERRTRWKPLYLERPMFIGLFYGDSKDVMVSDRKKMAVSYHDQNIRLLMFGKEEATRDYMLVLRSRAS